MLDPRNQCFLGMCRFGCDEDRVIAGDRADHAGPAAAVEGQGDALGRAGAGMDDEQVGSGCLDAPQQVRDGLQLAVVSALVAR